MSAPSLASVVQQRRRLAAELPGLDVAESVLAKEVATGAHEHGVVVRAYGSVLCPLPSASVSDDLPHDAVAAILDVVL